MAEPECPQKSPIIREEEPGDRWWCACGRSAAQPFCDGSHAGTEFRPLKVEITEKKTIAWCACKRSGKAPHCDGTHKQL